MSYISPRALIALIFGIFIIGQPLTSFAAGGTCPSGANYLSLSSPQTGNGYGSVTLSSIGVNSCFFVSATGNDSNDGTSESTSWLHAPGMPDCTGTCKATAMSAGTGIILRGGDTWHKNSGSPGMGGEWNFSASGNSLSSPIYVGVDFTWYAGGSFARPIINEDNPLSTSLVSGCSYPADDTQAAQLSGSFVIFDAIEFAGSCSSAGGGGQTLNNGTNNNIVERVYIHGWTVSKSATDDSIIKIGPGNGGIPDNTDRYLFNVIDGSDSTYGTVCTTPSCVASFGGNTGSGATGWGMSGCWDVEYSIIRHTSQGMLCGDASIVHDNLFEYIFNANYGRHSNVFEIITPGSGNLCKNLVAYNNVSQNWVTGVGWWPQCENYFIFNNVWANSGHFPPDSNGLMLSPPGTSGTSVVTAYIYNNTFQASQLQAGPANAQTPGWASGSVAYLSNSQIMDFTSINSFFICSSGNNCNVTDNGGEVFQTTSAANNQGYVIANSYAPMSATGATVGAGNNASSWCGSIPNSDGAAACASGSSGAVFEQSGWGGMMAVYSSFTANQRTGAWDAGAYQYASSNKPAPPTGLTAAVQ